jgi:hypothetical protein
MFYFIYCTWFDPKELAKYSPTAVFVTKASAMNHMIQFRTAGERKDRGWCHLSNSPDARGFVTRGLVYMLPEKDSIADFDDFERCFLTVRGEDGNVYDCFTYRLTNPGVPMRPPKYYWQHIPDGLRHWDFSPDYIAKIEAIYQAALPCPDEDRSPPSEKPGKSAESR